MKRLATAIVFLAACALSAAAPAPYPVTVNSRADRAPDLVAFRGGESLFRVTYTDGLQNPSDVSTVTPYMAWYTNANATVVSTEGSDDHALLDNLAWIGSGHTGTAGRVAFFGEGGIAGEMGFGAGLYLDGDDNIAVSNSVIEGAAAGATALQAETDPVWAASSNAVLSHAASTANPHGVTAEQVGAVATNDPAYLAALTNAAFAAQDGVTVDGRTLNIGTNLLGGAGGGGGAWDSFYGAREDLGVGLVISWIPTKWTGKWSPSNNAAFNMHPTNTYPRGTFSLWHYPTTTNRSITFEPSVSVQTVFTPTGTNLWIFTPGDTVTNWLAVGRSF
jgi:hypothetical protein